MTLNGWAQIALFCLAVLACVKPLGLYMAKVLEGEWAFLSPVERLVYRLGLDRYEGNERLQIIVVAAEPLRAAPAPGEASPRAGSGRPPAL